MEIIRGAPLGPRVVEASAQEGYILHLVFDNGEKRFFDVKPLLEYKAFQALKNKALFQQVKVEYGTVAWPGDIDYCPDTLYAQSKRALPL